MAQQVNNPNFYVNSRNLTMENLVYVTGSNGRNMIAATTELGVDEKSSDVFVSTSDGETGIYHPNLVKEFASQYTPRPRSGDDVIDEARADIDYNSFLTKKFSQKSDEVFSSIRSQNPEMQEQIRGIMRDVDVRARSEAEKMKLSPEREKEYVNLQTFKALGDSQKGTELGIHAREAYALGSYSRDSFDHTVAKYGLPHPGDQQVYNAADRKTDEKAVQTEDPRMKQYIEQRQAFQFLSMMSMFGSGGMSFFPFMMMPFFF
ncbi:MAG: hypothetical protein RDV48_13930 [Candidatus Eremiobacteraeota bacterium]|nr:hypothetical protein [Candidatus Eremiobacteraeota bacterium]